MNDVTLTVARPWVVLFFLACSTLGGCDVVADDEATFDPMWDGTPGMLGVVEFLNAPSTTFHLLDLGVGLERRAAEGIIAHRNGADGWLGTSDDNLFDTIDEVDQVDFVGPATLARLATYLGVYGTLANAQGLLGVYDGVEFSFEEASQTVKVANETSFEILDQQAGLHATAVHQIVNSRPIDSIAQLASLKGVGPKTLAKLKAWAMAAGAACVPSPPLAVDEGEPLTGRWTICTEPSEYSCTAASHVSGPALLESLLSPSGEHGPCVHVVDPVCSFVDDVSGTCCYVVEIIEACKG
jgi:hypothetical protein